MPRPEVAILTASFGGHDHFQPQTKQDIPVDWIAYTDEADERPPWNITVEQPNGHPNLQAKRYKLLPPLPHRYVVWIDANIRVESRAFAREALSHIRDGLAVHRHPFRDCVFQEALETILTPKYDHLPIAEQVRHYHRHEGCAPHQGLYACGVIAWDREDERAQRLGEEWMAECERWGYQDQLSAPVVMQRLGIQPGVFPHNQYRSPWLRILPHR